MTEKVTKLLELSRNAFGAWREHERFRRCDSTTYEVLSKHLGNKIMLGDASPELYNVMMDRDMIMNLVAASSDSHMRFIDGREDQLTTRAYAWRDDLVQGTNENEVKRNRDRILEINYFIDNQREEWADMHMELTDTVDPDAVALLGDDFQC